MPKRISLSEHKIMEALWERNPLTASELAARVDAGRGWAVNTVKTLLSRLVAKNVVAYDKDGPRHRYRPLIEREDYVAAESRQFLDRLFGGNLTPLVAHFAIREELTTRDIGELKKLIDGLNR